MGISRGWTGELRKGGPCINQGMNRATIDGVLASIVREAMNEAMFNTF